MTTINEVMVTCPLCGELSSMSIIGSAGSSGQDEDFCPQYWGANPLPFLLHSCHNCKFTVYAEDFEAFSLSKKDSASLLKELSKFNPKANPPSGTERFDLAGICYEILGLSECEMADLFLKASWSCRLEEDKREKEFQQKAIRSFETALANNDVPEQELPAVTYLVGELYRRLGDKKKALDFYQRAGGLPAIPEWLSKLIVKQTALLQK